MERKIAKRRQCWITYAGKRLNPDRLVDASHLSSSCMPHQLTTCLRYSPTRFFIQLIIGCRSSELSCMYAKQVSGIRLYSHMHVRVVVYISSVRALSILQHPASMFLYQVIHLSFVYTLISLKPSPNVFARLSQCCLQIDQYHLPFLGGRRLTGFHQWLCPKKIGTTRAS